MELAQKLIELRKAAGLSQDNAATALGITRQAVSRWEQGVNVPSLESLRALSRLYGVSLDELLCYDNAVPEKKEQGEAPKAEKEPCRRWTKERKIILVLCVLLAAAVVVIGYLVCQEKEGDSKQFSEIESGMLDGEGSEDFSFDW